MSDDREELLKGFGDLLDWIAEWRQHRGEAGAETYYQAGHIVAAMRELHHAMGFHDVLRHRVHADARDRDEDAPPCTADLRDGRALLRALRRILMDGMTDIIAPGPLSLLFTDTQERLDNRAPLIYGNGTVRIKPLRQIIVIEIVTSAHYRAGLDGTTWPAELARVAPDYSDGYLRKLNRSVKVSVRELARRAGRRRGRQLKLTAAELRAEKKALVHTVIQQRALLLRLRAR